MNSKIESGDDVQVHVIGDGEWSGTLAEFLQANADGLDESEVADIRVTIARGETYSGGRGAAGAYTVARVAHALPEHPVMVGTAGHGRKSTTIR